MLPPVPLCREVSECVDEGILVLDHGCQDPCVEGVIHDDDNDDQFLFFNVDLFTF